MFRRQLGLELGAGYMASLLNEKVVLQPGQMPWHLRTRGPET